MCMVSDKYYLNELILQQKKWKKRKWKRKKNEHDGTPIAELEMFEQRLMNSPLRTASSNLKIKPSCGMDCMPNDKLSQTFNAWLMKQYR